MKRPTDFWVTGSACNTSVPLQLRNRLCSRFQLAVVANENGRHYLVNVNSQEDTVFYGGQADESTWGGSFYSDLTYDVQPTAPIISAATTRNGAVHLHRSGLRQVSTLYDVGVNIAPPKPAPASCPVATVDGVTIRTIILRG